MWAAAGPAAVQLRRLQHQIPAPVSLQGLSHRPGGTVQGLPMTRAAFLIVGESQAVAGKRPLTPTVCGQKAAIHKR